MPGVRNVQSYVAKLNFNANFILNYKTIHVVIVIMIIKNT